MNRRLSGLVVPGAVLVASVLVSCVAFAQQGSVGLGPTKAVVVLHDVSGSVGERHSGWYDALRRAALAIVGGDRESLGADWSMVGPQALLDSLALAHDLDIGVGRFGTAPAQAPYINLGYQSGLSAVDRAKYVDRTFPARTDYVQGRTYVRLAEAFATDQLAQRHYSVGYLVVLSDFLSDADYNIDQRHLVDSYEANSLALKETGTLILQFEPDPNISIRVIRVAGNAAVVQATNPGPGAVGPASQGQPGLRLEQPGGSVNEGRVVFSWTAVPGASTYVLEIRPIGTSAGARRMIESGASHSVPKLDAGKYRWSVTARSASGQPLASAERGVTVTGGGGVRTILFLLIVMGIIAGASVWYVRVRRRAAKPSLASS